MADTVSPYAIVETGGKQYVVRTGDLLTIEKLAGEAGAEIALDRVLAVSDGRQLTVGHPVVAGAQVVGSIVAQTRAPKVVSYKYKRRKGFHWKKGHRQSVTKLKVLKVVSGHGQ